MSTMTPAETEASENVGRMSRFGWAFGMIWLFYLAYPLGEALSLPDVWQKVLATLVIIAFGATFVATFWGFRNANRAHRRIRSSYAWAGLGVMGALVVALAVMVGTQAFGATIYMAVLAVMTLPSRQAWTTVAVMVAVVEIVPRLVPEWNPGTFFAFQLVISAVAAWGITQVFKRNHELAAARQQLADLAIVAERERVGRDVHDILGHSLTVITVKAELAGRLIDIDPARAAVEIGQVESLAREALSDVRSTVGGLRKVDIATELASARSALATAGIEPDLPADADVVPLRNRELFGWTLREAVTNVIRHSGAERCTVVLGATRIEISDDGSGMTGRSGEDGNGLRGLADRVRAAQGSLSVGRSAAGGFSLEVECP
ncbi:sensor histidine kinase [Rhodococcus sp. BP-252]|nr:sensor histidine kinase [Rhodococcus sp. BP-320]MBY6416160.1 sensor histidine kinase [Rhodococcus sp. BP-321]MBY6423516.1 sensor histidine kinase [Rhodococcus sp. BP-324]MBY6426367.1 sensor histidine kinase [Rhodococcus sp. BP-323]MBY6431092.1 sensor histidine kinase [Rhodococcus sp. BP-322]MBY6440580.1 sensor histidine kinase [Rhodococcus sp. BP-319]MBY6445203.1 sensor histidine kinase [Rhodococcus sp. BP-318]MBY6450253.1 sensor histidine kinase [Rhodococcus sp. BP-315]MBY6457145.1 sens